MYYIDLTNARIMGSNRSIVSVYQSRRSLAIIMGYSANSVASAARPLDSIVNFCMDSRPRCDRHEVPLCFRGDLRPSRPRLRNCGRYRKRKQSRPAYLPEQWTLRLFRHETDAMGAQMTKKIIPFFFLARDYGPVSLQIFYDVNRER